MSFLQAVSGARKIPSVSTPRIIQTNCLHEYDPGKYTSGSTLVDQQGNRNLTINGATYQTSPPAFDYDGVNDSITSGTFSDNLANFTLGVWVNFNSVSGLQALHGHWNTSNFEGMIIFRNGNNNTIAFRIEDANGVFMGINYSHIPATSTWFYYAMTWQNSPNEVKIYLYNSGGLFHTDTNTSFTGRDMSLTRTGVKTVVGDDTYPVDGIIGEAHTYSAKLSQTDITANYNSTKARYGY